MKWRMAESSGINTNSYVAVLRIFNPLHEFSNKDEILMCVRESQSERYTELETKRANQRERK